MKIITDEYLDELINYSDLEYYRFINTTMTVCCITLPNGFSVIGKSACISEELFDAELGRKYALEDAKSKLWELEAYLVKDKDESQAEALTARKANIA